MKKRRTIFLVDMQSFYASIEKASNHAYRNKPLIVAGDPEKRSGIVLAACPIAKSYGVTTTEWIKTALSKCPDLIVVQPRMEHYIQVSLQIASILHRYSDLVEPYSIDELHIDVTGTLHLYSSVYALARDIQMTIQAETGIRARIGIGSNKTLAKAACDIHAKKNESGIFELDEDNIPTHYWTQPIPTMFMVGNRMTRHLQRMGVYTIGELAQTPLPKFKEMLRLRFGKQSDIHAELLWQIANGIDNSPVSPESHDTQKGIGHHMTMPRDYHLAEELEVVLLELSEEVCRRARSKGYAGDTVMVSCRGADFDHPTGFHRQAKLPITTNHGSDVYDAAKQLFREHWDGNPVRSVGVTLNGLAPDTGYQADIFRDREAERKLDKAIDKIKDRYGDAAIMRASSLTAAGQAKQRAMKIGGHYK